MPTAARRSRKPAFTLLELLIVVGIVAALVAILLPSLARARRQAEQVRCAANLKSIFTAMLFYTEDRQNGNGYLPQMTWFIHWPGDYWSSQIHSYVAIKRSRAGAKDGLLVCPSDPSPQYRWITGERAGYEATEQDKRREDAGRSNRPVGRRVDTGASVRPLIEPVSYTGSCDTVQNHPRFGWFPRKWGELKRPHCFVMLAEPNMVTRCFRFEDMVQNARHEQDYKRHFGGESPRSNGTNFLFADGHVQWHSAEFAATKMICCMDFGFGDRETTTGDLHLAAGAENLRRKICFIGQGLSRR